MGKISAANDASSVEKKRFDFREFARNGLWGPMGKLSWPARIVTLVFVIVAIASMSFTQLGFWSIGVIDGKSVYLMLILAPLSAGALLFGPIIGGLLGLFTGVVLLGHATFLPLDFYEAYFMSSSNTLGTFTILGFLLGFLFHRFLDGENTLARRTIRIVAICLFGSFAASGLTLLNTLIVYGGLEYLDLLQRHLFNTPLGITVQALVDALLMIILTVLAEDILFIAKRTKGHRSLRSIFQNWMILVTAIVFMVASAIMFSLATIQAQVNAKEQMSSEIDYLKIQLDDRGIAESESIVSGYDVNLDGRIAIVDKEGIIVASDDPSRFEKGESLIEQVKYSDMGYSINEFFDTIIMAEDGYMELQDVDENGIQTMDCVYVKAGRFDDGFLVVMYDGEKIYSERFGIMLSMTLLTVLLITAISILAVFLLSNVVVKRINETNTSLGKITHGDLSERIRVHDSVEFASLASGINTTVSALRDSIEEAEQKNAQELLTAKAIQESALPREFPPFPEIDRFDIYASMKTAKEVGGDFYDFFLIDDNKLGFVLADVSGKGIPAALFMMTAKTQIKNYMQAGLDINEAINAANHQLCLGNDAGMFVTVFACLLDYDSGALNYVNAGHNPPLILHEGTWEWLRDVSGMPLGLFDGIPYDSFSRQLVKSDMLYMYTDGVTEAMNASGELFGENRLLETLYRYAGMNSRSVSVGVRRALTDFTLDADQSDDITTLCLKYGVPPEKRAIMILRAEVQQLVHVYNFVHEELHRRSAPEWVANPLDIAAEELFVNVCHYAYPDATPDDPGEVRISFEYNANPPSLTVEISDDGIPYNPLEKPDAVTPDDINDVPIGGLGILMAKKSVDEMTYRRENGSNILTFRKGW